MKIFPYQSIITQAMYPIKPQLGHLITLFPITKAMSTGTPPMKVEIYFHHGIPTYTQIHTIHPV